MAEISAALVKELREKTGAGMMDCKKALTETGGDMDEAVDWLRKKGLSAAAKKAGRVAAEGLVAVATEGNKAAILEVNAETDFVARNDQFQEFVREAVLLTLQADGDVEKLKEMDYPGAGRSVGDQLTQLIATIGENMSIRRAATLEVKSGVVASYVHNQTAPGLGKIGVIVGLESTAEAEKLEGVGKQIAMHIAAAAPLALDKDDLDAEAVERERSVLADQARASGKPEEIINKMVEGRLRKFYEESCLLDQVFVIDNESRVRDVVAQLSDSIGAPVEVAGFVRYQLGEGIEKKEDDFAAEVAATAGG
ncbi:MAG: translation elongation factor Ts [Rhodovibrionaceae bacterium]|nr:translation elongation factor Ts [Rhodovibrionaceae bacterium]